MRIAIPVLLALALQDADKIKAAVSKYESRHYSVTSEGKSVGSLTLESKLDADGVVFKDTLKFEDGGKTREFVITVKAALDGNFTPRSMTVEAGGETSKAEFKDRKMTVGDQTKELKKTTFAGFSVLRKFALLEAKEGAVFEFDNIGFDGFRVEEGQKLTYKGTKKITRGEKEVEAAVWRMDEPNRDGADMFIVDGVIVRVEAPDSVFELVSKK